ncbi:MAG: hypothetical protein JWN56_1530 [Sphingobacteriales bacterium]|nr:hypothetical protein [Sphingobacteriales bacterium]
MKPIHGLLMGATMTFALMSCNNKGTADGDASTDTIIESTDMGTTATTSNEVVPGSYVDLNTGKKVYIIRDNDSGYATDSIAKVPIEFYINSETKDTLYRTGMVVNNMLVEEDGKWKLDETKVKIDGDKIKMKDGDSKTKINGEESKVKDGDYKEKVDGEDVKIKDGDTKIKIEDGKVKEKH